MEAGERPAGAGEALPPASSVGSATLAERVAPPGARAGSWRGRYVILRTHAKGGLGVISLAMDESLGRRVALKQMREDLADDLLLRQRFIREAELTGQLEHPGIIPLYSLGQDENGRPYYAMKFVEGRTFEEAIAAHHASGGKSPSLRELLRRFVEICQAVAYAHSQGIIHRDLKPSNIMVGKFGETLILDWGLGKRVTEADAPTAVAHTPPAGTPAYMSPEQADGNSSEVGPASDVYGLGAVLYQLLVGKPPYAGCGSRELIRRVLQGPPQAPQQLRPDVPTALDAVCCHAMSRRPFQRPDALSLAQEVERWLADEPMLSVRSSVLDTASRWARRHRALAAAGISGLLALVVALSVGTVLVTRERNAKSAALHSEAAQRRLAEQRESTLRRHLYAANMRDAVAAWNGGHGRRALSLHTALAPGGNAPDLRGFEWHVLAHQMRDGLVGELVTPWSVDVGLDVSHDGSLLAAACADRAVRVWDAPSQELRATLWGAGAKITSVAIAPDGRAVAAGDSDGVVHVWDLDDSGAGIGAAHSAPAHAAGATQVAFSPKNGRVILASCGQDGALRTWTRDAEAQSSRAASSSPLRSLAFAPDGASILTAGEDGALRQWDAATGQPLRVITVLRRAAGAIAVAPDGLELAVGSGWDVTVHRLDTGQEVVKYEHAGGILGVCYSPDGRAVITSSGGGEVVAWQRDSGAKRAFATPGLAAIARLPHGLRIASAMGARRIWFWDFNTTRNPLTLGDPQFPVTCVAIDARRGVALAGTSTGHLQLWNLAASRITRSAQAAAPVTAIAISPDGSQLFVGDARGNLSLRDITTLDERASHLRAHDGAIRALVISPDARHMVSIGADQSISLWDITDNPRRVGSHQGIAAAAAFAHDGKSVVVAAAGQMVNFLDVPTFRITRSAPAAGSIQCVALSPDGRTLAMGGVGANAVLWDLPDSSDPGRALQTELFTVTALAFLDEGRRLVTANPYRSIQFWDLVTAEECGTFEANVAMDSPIAVSPDGSAIAVVTRDQRMCIFRGR